MVVGRSGWTCTGPTAAPGHSCFIKPDPSLFLTLLLQQQSASLSFPGVSKATIPLPPMIFHNGGSSF